MTKQNFKIETYLDSTYLKTSEELKIDRNQNRKTIFNYVMEAVKFKFACIMIRPEQVKYAYSLINDNFSDLKIGTVIDFPFGTSNLEEKIMETNKAINDGANDLDFVCDYNAFKRGFFEKFDREIIECTQKGILENKIIKWIIETGALSNNEIREISFRIKDLLQKNISNNLENVFIKTSTGYYSSFGANTKDIKMIKSIVGNNLQIKASGGISSFEECIKMIESGANRIGTSKAALIYKQAITKT